MFPMFLPWFIGTDMYPKPAWLRIRPIPTNWMPNADTRLHAAKAKLYVQSSPLLAKHLGTKWEMPREQQWFWQVNHEEAKAKDAESSFLQEMAGDDEEALQRSTESVFGHETIEVIDQHRDKEYACYTMVGQSIEQSHEVGPEYYDYAKERLPVRYVSTSKGTSRWELIPLKRVALNEKDLDDSDGVLFIWEHPKPNINYSMGVDTGSGQGHDFTCISVWALGYGDMPDVQVAEYASRRVSHVESFAFVMPIAAYYGKFMEKPSTRWKEPYVSIEQVAAVGDVCQHQMGLMGYTNFHRMPRYDGSPKKIMKQKRMATKIGWYTWGWSRPILTDSFVHWARNGWAKVNSPWLLEEMRHFEVHLTASGKERKEHEEGENDDRIFAGAMAIFCPHDMEQMAHRSKKRIEDPASLPPIDLGPYHGNTYSPRQLAESNVVSLDDILYSDAQLDRYRQ
jgi:hypothetical protein